MTSQGGHRWRTVLVGSNITEKPDGFPIEDMTGKDGIAVDRDGNKVPDDGHAISDLCEETLLAVC